MSQTEVIEGTGAPAPTVETEPVSPAGWRGITIPLGLFLASRVLAVAAAWVANFINPAKSFGTVLNGWDGNWYLGIASGGYPSVVPRGSGPAVQSSVAFFPGFPLAIRAVVELTGVEARVAGMFVNGASAAGATVLLWLLAKHVSDPPTASRVVALFCFFPGSFVLSMVYSEGLFLLAATASLYLLVRHAWLTAGLACAVASATRPSGLVVVACCAAASWRAVRSERDWRAVGAPLLGVTGFLAYASYLRVRTGSAMSWAYAQTHGWDQGFDFGRNTLSRLGDVAAHPLADFNLLVSTIALLFMIGAAALWYMSSWRPPAVLYVYTAGILAPALMSTVWTSTARFTMTAFPLFIAVGRRVRGDAFYALLAMFAGGMTILMVVSGASLGYTP